MFRVLIPAVPSPDSDLAAVPAHLPAVLPAAYPEFPPDSDLGLYPSDHRLPSPLRDLELLRIPLYAQYRTPDFPYTNMARLQRPESLR